MHRPSADIGVLRRGRPVLSAEERVADSPILIPTVAVSAIGAGGGSIIWADATGTLKIGPKSTGADPGRGGPGPPGSGKRCRRLRAEPAIAQEPAGQCAVRENVDGAHRAEDAQRPFRTPVEQRILRLDRDDRHA